MSATTVVLVWPISQRGLGEKRSGRTACRRSDPCMKLVLHQMVNAGLAIHPAYGSCTIGTFHSEPIPLR
jgi:hypothetical protein